MVLIELADGGRKNETEKEKKHTPSSVGESLSGETGSSKRAKNFLSFFQSNRPTEENIV